MRALGLVVVMTMCALVAGARLARSETPATTGEHKAMTPNEMQWADAPPNLPKAVKMAVLAGDPTKTGLFVVRLKLPAGQKVMPHWHPTDENLTVISGSFAVGMGDKLETSAKGMPAGSFVRMPAKMHHYAMAKTDSVVEIASMGPFMITYVDPKDDPSKKQASANQ